eukprot:230852-Chlamydomonas_euryale.AAC.1
MQAANAACRRPTQHAGGQCSSATHGDAKVAAWFAPYWSTFRSEGPSSRPSRGGSHRRQRARCAASSTRTQSRGLAPAAGGWSQPEEWGVGKEFVCAIGGGGAPAAGGWSQPAVWGVGKACVCVWGGEKLSSASEKEHALRAAALIRGRVRGGGHSSVAGDWSRTLCASYTTSACACTPHARVRMQPPHLQRGGHGVRVLEGVVPPHAHGAVHTSCQQHRAVLPSGCRG